MVQFRVRNNITFTLRDPYIYTGFIGRYLNKINTVLLGII